MSAHTPMKLLRVVEEAACGADHVAMLGRNISTSPERITSIW